MGYVSLLLWLLWRSSYSHPNNSRWKLKVSSTCRSWPANDVHDSMFKYFAPMSNNVSVCWCQGYLSSSSWELYVISILMLKWSMKKIEGWQLSLTRNWLCYTRCSSWRRPWTGLDSTIQHHIGNCSGARIFARRSDSCNNSSRCQTC